VGYIKFPFFILYSSDFSDEEVQIPNDETNILKARLDERVSSCLDDRETSIPNADKREL
jgi:hypothetical protein